jgi:hypothetical protein
VPVVDHPTILVCPFVKLPDRIERVACDHRGDDEHKNAKYRRCRSLKIRMW